MSFIKKKVDAYPWPVEVRKPSEEIAGDFEIQKYIAPQNPDKNIEKRNFETKMFAKQKN